GVELRRFQRIVAVAAQLERPPNNVRTTARRHDFVAGGDERRTHDRRIFAATAAAVALLEIADERMVFESESESWLERQVNRSREIVAEVVVDLVGESKNFSGIENVLRIQCALDFAHDVQ